MINKILVSILGNINYSESVYVKHFAYIRVDTIIILVYKVTLFSDCNILQLTIFLILFVLIRIVILIFKYVVSIERKLFLRSCLG